MIGKDAIAAILSDLGYLSRITKDRSYMHIDAFVVTTRSEDTIELCLEDLDRGLTGEPRNSDRYEIKNITSDESYTFGGTYLQTITGLERALRDLLHHVDVAEATEPKTKPNQLVRLSSWQRLGLDEAQS